MKIPIVNEQDEVISYKTREETTRDDIRRIVALYVFNEKGEVLIAKRHPDKKIDPNCWGPAVAGTVDEGYDYDQTVIKEAEEEIGLINFAPIFFEKSYYEVPNARRICARYYTVINSNITLKLQEDEVSEVRWVDINTLEDWAEEHPQEFVPSFNRTGGALKNMREIYDTKIKN